MRTSSRRGGLRCPPRGGVEETRTWPAATSTTRTFPAPTRGGHRGPPLRLLVLISGFLMVLNACVAPPAPAPPTEVQLVAMSFTDPARGWVAAKECSGICRVQIYRTVDGGATWARAAHFLLTPRALAFADPQNGWLVGSVGDNCGAQNCPNAIMLTTDGGLQWDRVSSVSTELLDVSTRSPMDAWAVGTLCVGSKSCAPTLVKTASGGQTWVNQTLPIIGRDFQLQQLDPTTAIVGGTSTNGAAMARTEDGGKTWLAESPPCSGQEAGFTFRGTEGWLLCAAPPGGSATQLTVLHSADGGATWTTISHLDAPAKTRGAAPIAPTGAIAFTSPTNGWISLGTGAIERTIDGGRTWTTVLSTTEALHAVRFADAENGWVLGHRSIWRTTDGGATWRSTSILGGNWPLLPSPPRRGDVE